ncbi:MAG: hypothetical protein AB1578_09785 [Thermodesulfobacteriota bacterium]|jgi:hypothetical protein
MPEALPADPAPGSADRVFYGSDFCNLPYAWDRELRQVRALGLSDARLEKLLFRNAGDFFGLPAPRPQTASGGTPPTAPGCENGHSG